MAQFKDKLNEIKNTISNQDEATKVMSIIMEITEGYEDKLMEIEKRQTMLEERTAEIIEMLQGFEEELEAALNASNTVTEEKTTKKKYKKNYNKEEEEEEKVEIKRSTPINVLPVYTEEELRAIQEAEEAEEASKYDDDIDYDEFEDYYDDED